MKNIGDTLKKLREENGMTRKEAAEKLKALGIDISDKTLYGYESGRNSANADMFLSLCKIYKCNDIMETFFEAAQGSSFTANEWDMIEKYRLLDAHGREMVDFTLLKEWERATSKAGEEKVISMIPKTDPYYVNAAHADDYANAPEELKRLEEDIMDDENF